MEKRRKTLRVAALCAAALAVVCAGVALSGGFAGLSNLATRVLSGTLTESSATTALSAEESLSFTSEDTAPATQQSYSEESLAKFADIMTIENGAGETFSLTELPQSSYSGFIFSVANAALGQGDVSSVIQQAQDLGLVQHVHGQTYTIGSLDTLAGILDASKLEYVQPNYVIHLAEESAESEAATASSSPLSTQGGTASNPAPSYPPTDPQYLSGNLWNLDMLNVQGAWELGLDGDVYIHNNSAVRDTPVKVAVIDTGMYGTGDDEPQHEDFDYSHVVDGYNFVTADEGTPDAKGHGTFVSGIIAAQVNNGVGVAGFMPGAYIVPCKVFDTSNASTSNVVKAIYYAVDTAQVDVINMSLGGEYNEASLEAACEYAVSQGVLVVASAGNDGVSTPNYPAAYDCVVGVASVNSSQARSTWSQYGKSVFVTAPGENVTSTYIDSADSYKTASGTSFSGPEVAAMAAMCKAVYPDITQDVFKNFLIETSTDLGTKGYDDYYGYGLVNFQTMAQSVLASQTLPWYSVSFDVQNADGVALANTQITVTAAEDISWEADSEEHIETGSIAAGSVIDAEEDGTYKLHRGCYNYTVSADGYYMASGTFKTYAASQTESVQLERAYSVSVSVVNSAGQVLDSVHLAVYSSTGRAEVTVGGAANDSTGAGTTNAASSFNYNLMPGIYTYTAQAQGGYITQSGSFVVQREDKQFSIAMYQQEQLCEVSFAATDSETQATLENVSTTVYDSWGNVVFAQENGIYLLARGVEYKTICMRLGYEDVVKTFTVDNTNAMTVDVSMSSAECALTFKVVTDDAQALNQATITVANEQGTQMSSSASSPYRFNLKAGTYRYSISAPGYVTATGSFNVSLESRTLTIVLTGIPQVVQFSAQDTSTKLDLTGVSVKVTSATSTTAIKAQEDGSYLLAPGEYRYRAYLLGYASSQGSFTVEGEALTVNVALTPYSSGSDSFAGGSGTVDDPYLIATEDQLRYLAQQTDIVRAQKSDAETNKKDTVTGYYQLVADIELGGVWLPIGNYEHSSNYVAFAGVFDGAGHTISGLHTTDLDYDAQGLFGCLQSATISNLTVSGSVRGNEYVGGVAGYVLIANQNASDDDSVASTRIENCSNQVNVVGRYAAGGIVGASQGSTQSSETYGTVVSKCSNYGTVQASKQGEFSRNASTAGGIVGSAGGCKIEYCYNRATIQAGYIAGGLVGQSLGCCSLNNCYNAGTVYEYLTGSGYAGTSGSIAGRLAKTSVTSCYGLYPADENAVFTPIGTTDSATASALSEYKMLEREEMWRNASFLTLLNTNLANDTISVSFVMGASYPVLSGEVSAGVTFAEEPFITTQPESVKTVYTQGSQAEALTATVGQPADSGTITWQWYEASDAQGTTFSALDGAAGTGCEASYVPATDVVGTRYYAVVFTNTLATGEGASAGNSAGASFVTSVAPFAAGASSSARSNIASVSVRSVVDAQTPSISAFNPTSAQDINTSISAKVTTDVLLSVQASTSDGGTLSYQWYRGSSMVGNGTAVTDATQASYQPDTSALGTLYYYVEVTNTTEPGNMASVKSDWVAVTVNPYTIGSYEELLSFRTAVNSGTDFSGLVVTLTCDIDVSKASWEPIGTLDHPFRGTFMGGAGYAGSSEIVVHTIRGLQIDGAALDNSDLGLFGVVEAATICDVVVQGNVTGAENRYAGLLVGRALSSSTASTSIENCATTANSSIEGKYAVGGLVGYGCVNVKDSVNHAAVTGRAFVPNTIDKGLDQRSYTVKAVGGVVGYSGTNYVQGCYNTGSVSVEEIDASAGQKCAYYVGGVVGYSSTTAAIASCFDSGVVQVGTFASSVIYFKPAGVCYAGAVVGYQADDNLYNTHYLEGTCEQGTNGSAGYNYAECHTLAYMKTAYYLGQLHDGYNYGAAFAQSVNGVPHLAWEEDLTTGNPLTDAAEAYLYDVTIDGIDDITSTWSTYFYQGEKAPSIVVWADQAQPEGGSLTYQWYQRLAGDTSSSWQAIVGENGVCARTDDNHYTAALPLSTQTIGINEYQCVITNTLVGATGIASCDNETPALTIEIRENQGTFALQDSTQENSKDNPWIIETPDQLHFLALLVNGQTKMVGVSDTTFKGQYIDLAADLDLSKFEQWTPIGTGDGDSASAFSGYFNGKGHSISGLQIGNATQAAAAADYQALFGSVAGGAIRNLCVSGTVNMAAGSWMTGGIVAYAYGSALENLANHVNVTGEVRVGGVCATAGTCQVKDCVNTGTITVASSTSTKQYGVGGIVGYAFNTHDIEGVGLYNCLNLGNVSCTLAYGADPRFGAILGEVNSGTFPLENCYYLAGSATCLTDSSTGTGVGSSIGYIADEQGVCESYEVTDQLRTAWLLNMGATNAEEDTSAGADEDTAGTSRNSERFGRITSLDEEAGTTTSIGLVICKAQPVFQVDTTANAAQITVSAQYACAGDEIGVSWREKPGFTVRKVAWGIPGAKESDFVALQQTDSFVMPAGNVSFEVSATQDTGYLYNLSSSVVSAAGEESANASVALYAVSLGEDGVPIKGEAITAAKAGATVMVELTVEQDYQVRSVSVAGLYGSKVSLQRLNGTCYYFTMPADETCVTLVVEPQGSAAESAAPSLAITNDNVHVLNTNDAYHTGNLLYDTVTLSGSAAAENSYVTVAHLEGATTSVTYYEQEYSIDGVLHRITGIPVTQYIRQYISDPTTLTSDTLITFQAKDGTQASYTWEQLNALVYNSYINDTNQPITRGLPVLLAFGQDGAPYVDNAVHVVFGQTSAADNNAQRLINGITRIVVGDDTNYAQHCYGTYDNLNTVGGSDVVINIYQGDSLQTTKTYTVKDVEALANANRAGLYRGLYSTLVYESTETEYSGPFSDFYEGYSLYDVLLQAGLSARAADQNPQATVQFYQKGEWQDAWKTVNVSLGYLAGNGADGIGDYSNNFTMYGREDGSSSNGVAIRGMEPVLAYGKNNLPLVYASGTTGVSSTAYNYRGPLIALLPQNQVEGGYVAEQTVSACYLGQIDVYLPAPEEPDFVVASSEYTPKSGLKLVTYKGNVEQGQCIEIAGKKMFAGEDNTFVCLLPTQEANALTNASFTVTTGNAPTFTLGDANANGAVNVIDCQIAYDIACGVYDDFSILNEAGWLACDVNADAVVDASDAYTLQRHLLELLTNDPTF